MATTDMDDTSKLLYPTTMNTRDEFRNVSATVTEAVSVTGAHAARKADLNCKL